MAKTEQLIFPEDVEEAFGGGRGQRRGGMGCEGIGRDGADRDCEPGSFLLYANLIWLSAQ